MKKVAVLGSNSFSGSDFVDLLLEKKEFDVIGISRSPEKSKFFLPYKRHKNASFHFYQMDFNHDAEKISSVLDSFKPEYIVNFAAQSEVAPSWENPWDWYKTNVVSLSRLTEHLRNASYLKRYVHISSPEVYGSCRGIKEDALINPSTPYAVSKAAADMHLLCLWKQYQFPVVFVRSTNVYGAHQQLFKIIPRSIIYIKSGKIIELHGGGRAVKSYIHIRDISCGELLMMEKGRSGEVYHLSPDCGIAVRDLVEKICSMLNVDFKKATKMVDERPGQDAIYSIDSEKVRKELGWKPHISISHGLDQTIGWINDHWDAIQKEPLDYIHKH